MRQLGKAAAIDSPLDLFRTNHHNGLMNVCLFDIDGTLLTSGGAGKAAMESALRTEFALDHVYDGVPFSGRTDRAIARDLFRIHGIEEKPTSWTRFVAGYLRQLPGCLARHPGRVLPGITALLGHLGERGDVVIGLLTGNLREGARIKLGHFDLFHHFVCGGYGDVHHDRDDVAREALAAVGAYCRTPPAPDRLWVIGDTPLDVRCARAIGAKVLAVTTGWHSREELAAVGPDLLLADLSDPAPLLTALA
jgi:phosphoglycolate phosphatase-like HAD superfamily hydrolase